MYYSCEEEYNEAMNAQSEAEIMAEQFNELQKELESLELQKKELENQIEKIKEAIDLL